MTRTRKKRKTARAAIRLCRGPEGDKRWVSVDLPPRMSEHGSRLTLYEKKLLVNSEGYVEDTFVQSLVYIPWTTLARALRLQGGEWQLNRRTKLRRQRRSSGGDK